MSIWRVLIVEDDDAMGEFFAACVRRNSQLQLVAQVGTLHEALQLLDQATAPVDILLVDLGLPDGSGIDVIRHAKLRFPCCESLVISMFGDEDNVLSSIEAGALGYIHKDSAPEDISRTILEMKEGASPISPMIARRVLFKYASLLGRRGPIKAGAVKKTPIHHGVMLTLREQEVLELIARGFSFKEIAEQQAVSVHTVQSHVKNLYGKLAVHSKIQAVQEATLQGLLQAPV